MEWKSIVIYIRYIRIYKYVNNHDDCVFERCKIHGACVLIITEEKKKKNNLMNEIVIYVQKNQYFI
jgi:hypothetical protein